MSTAAEVIQAIIDTITGEVDGIRTAPDAPPESWSEFPALITYFASLTTEPLNAAVLDCVGTVTVELHLGNGEQQAMVRRANEYAISVPMALWRDQTLDGVIHDIGSGGNIPGELGALADGQTIGWRWQVPVTFQESMT